MLHRGRVMPCQMAGSKKTEAWLLLLEGVPEAVRVSET